MDLNHVDSFLKVEKWLSEIEPSVSQLGSMRQRSRHQVVIATKTSDPSAKRIRTEVLDDVQGFANAARMCQLLEGRLDVPPDRSLAFQLAVEGSHSGCMHSRGVLGWCYMKGWGVERDEQRGLQLGNESADSGSAYGNLVVAFACEKGVGGIEKNFKTAVAHYNVAVQQNIAEAQYCLASMYSPSFSVYKANTVEAVRLLRLASGQGHLDAHILLASIQDGGVDETIRLLQLALEAGTARNHVNGLHQIANAYTRKNDNIEAFKHFKLACDLGCLDSQLPLADMYLHGTGISQDIPEAIKLYTLVADDGQENEDFFIQLRNFFLERGRQAEALKWCKKGADQGHSCLQYDVARMYDGEDPRYNWASDEHAGAIFEGARIERNFTIAAEYYRSASDQGCDRASNVLAKMYMKGRGVVQSYQQAKRLLEKAWTDCQSTESAFRLACLYEEGLGVVQNHEKAADFYQKAVYKSCFILGCKYRKRSICRLASMHKDGRGVPQDKQQALQILNLHIEMIRDDSEANFLLASVLLEESPDSCGDVSKALSLLQCAADKNHADAQYLLACQLQSGDFEQIQLLKRASRSGHSNALFKLACLVADGNGVRDDEEAASLFMAAGAKGHVEAHIRLAQMFELGQGVAQSTAIAAIMYGQAAAKNSASALYKLARMHQEGRGVSQSNAEAFRLCSLAAVQGLAQAKHDLACMYQLGIGTEIVPSEAVRWFKEASAQGHQDAADELISITMASQRRTGFPGPRKQRAQAI